MAIIDLAPTILELASVDVPERMHGTSLVPWLFGSPPKTRPPVFSEMVKDSNHSSRKVMIDWPFKIHRSVTHRYWELFDLEADPGEKKNLKSKRPEVFARMRTRLKAWMRDELQEIEAGVRKTKRAAGGD